MNDKKLFLLDAYALIYRAYYALIRSPRFNSKGLNTSAIFGFCNTLDEILRKENPSHIAVCFDPPHGKTFRHELFEGYKATRQAQPEDITIAVPIIKEIIEAYNIPIFEIAGYEADDIIGTLSVKASEAGFTTYMMTPDKDYGQLVTDHVLMYRPSLGGQGFEIRGPKEVCEKYGIDTPKQVIDILALEGDSSDNIPGCPGIGPKTASLLIKQFGSVENMIEHAGQIKGANSRKVADNKEQILFSKKLATIKTDVPMDVDLDTLVRKAENIEKLKEIFTRLEFKSFIAKLTAQTKIEATAKSNTSAKQTAEGAAPSLFDFIDSEPVAAESPSQINTENFKRLTSIADVGAAIEQAMKSDRIGLYLYAVGEEAMRADLRAIAIAHDESDPRAVYIEVPGELMAQERAELMSVIEPLFTSQHTEIVSHDVKRDMVLLRRTGIEWSARYFDTSLAHYVLQPEMRHRLGDVAMTILEYQTLNYNDPKISRNPYAALPTNEELNRVCEQAAVTLRLLQPLRDLLERNGQLKLATDIEMPLARVLAAMEWNGVRIDPHVLRQMSIKLTERMNELENQAYELAGERFNTSSPTQVGEILFGRMKLDPKAKRTKTGAYSTTEEILEKHRHDHPIVDTILELRGVRKLLTTYVNALPELVNPQTGKIHTTFNQTVTATGRISSTNPNLQNIPIRTEEGREVRRAFVADEGCMILSADYSQIELRLLAAMSNDPDLTAAFRDGLDIHRATAAKIYHVPFDDVTDTQRRNAKTANFGTVYGISAFGLSERLGIPRSEAKELIDGYFRTYPTIKEYIAESIENARKNGYVSTIMGRKRFLPDITSRNATVRNFAERNAVNAPLQGSAADIIKLAMIRIYDALRQRGMRSTMIMQVHDELIFNVYPDELAQLQQLVTELMEGAYNGPVRLEVSSGVGANWLEAH